MIVWSSGEINVPTRMYYLPCSFFFFFFLGINHCIISYWEADLNGRLPTENNMEMWIRAKYEQRRWAAKGPVPDPSDIVRLICSIAIEY